MAKATNLDTADVFGRKLPLIEFDEAWVNGKVWTLDDTDYEDIGNTEFRGQLRDSIRTALPKGKKLRTKYFKDGLPGQASKRPTFVVQAVDVEEAADAA